ncbi:MAG TPA: hypothetical protein VF980_01340 [Thermoanaerobaculia bacterium]
MKSTMIFLLLTLFPMFAGAAGEKQSPFACNVYALSPEVRKRHFDELGPALRALKTGVHELPNGYEFQFPSSSKTFAMLAEWIDQERLCCPFFDIDLRIEREGGPLWMGLTGRPGTKEFIRADFAPWMR